MEFSEKLRKAECVTVYTIKVIDGDYECMVIQHDHTKNSRKLVHLSEAGKKVVEDLVLGEYITEVIDGTEESEAEKESKRVR